MFPRSYSHHTEDTQDLESPGCRFSHHLIVASRVVLLLLVPSVTLKALAVAVYSSNSSLSLEFRRKTTTSPPLVFYQQTTIFFPNMQASPADKGHGLECSCLPKEFKYPPCGAHCGNEGHFRIRCARCDLQYCSEKCFEKDYEAHQSKCAELDKLINTPKRCDARPFVALCYRNFLYERSEVSNIILRNATAPFCA